MHKVFISDFYVLRKAAISKSASSGYFSFGQYSIYIYIFLLIFYTKNNICTNMSLTTITLKRFNSYLIS